jgi:hypothetical protein
MNDEDLQSQLNEIGLDTDVPDVKLFDTETLAAFIKARDAKRDAYVKLGDIEIEFSHTAVNKDMHMFIDGYHNPDLCPECIQPGTLTRTL